MCSSNNLIWKKFSIWPYKIPLNNCSLLAMNPIPHNRSHQSLYITPRNTVFLAGILGSCQYSKQSFLKHFLFPTPVDHKYIKSMAIESCDILKTVELSTWTFKILNVLCAGHCKHLFSGTYSTSLLGSLKHLVSGCTIVNCKILEVTCEMSMIGNCNKPTPSVWEQIFAAEGKKIPL